MNAQYCQKPSLSIKSCLKNILSWKYLILYIFIFGFMVRLCVGLWFKYNLDSDYSNIARNLIQGTGYSLDAGHPTVWRTPGYPLILACLMALFGEQRMPLIILNAILGATNASLCAWLGMKIFRRPVGFVAGILYILTPYLAQKESTTEIGFIILGLLGGVCLVWKGWANKRLIWIGLSGLMFACSCLIRPTIGLIPIFISLSLLAAIAKTKKPLWQSAAAVILILAFIIGILPWGVRNKIVFGRWYFGQAVFWVNVYISNHPRTFDIYPYYSLDNFLLMFPPARCLKCHNELERELWFKKLAFTEIGKSHLKEILWRGCRKFLYLWSARMIPYTDRVGNDLLSGRPLDTPRRLWKNLAFSLPYLFLIILALRGAWQERRRKWLLFFTAGFFFFFSLPYMITVSYSRYAAPAYFVFILFAARGLVSLLPEKAGLTE